MEQTLEGELGYRLKLSGGVPKYPIVNKAFDVELSIVDEVDQIRYHNTEVQLVFRAVWEGSLELCPPDLVEVLPSTLFIRTNGTAVASITIKEVSALHDNNKILIIFEERKRGAGCETDSIASTSTPALCCVRHKLTIEDWDEKDRLMTSPYVWYKDEGGKDKCIELKICLTDECDRKVHNRIVPLKATLMYECGQEVQQQNILVINLHDSKVSIDDSGEGVIKLRINEVSNRHRSQRFQIMVSAEHQPDCSDISPAFSIPVDVKSKRNNRPREGDPLNSSFSTSDLSEIAGKRKLVATKSVSNFESHYSSSAVALPLNPIAVGENLSQMKRAKQSKAHTQAMSQSVVTNMSANINNYSANQIQALSSQYTDHSSSGSIGGGGGGGVGLGNGGGGNSTVGGSMGGSGENLSCAVDHVIRWATTVMTAVEKIQWRPLEYSMHELSSATLCVNLHNNDRYPSNTSEEDSHNCFIYKDSFLNGFAQNLDGSHDFSRCLSSIPDPTLHIVEIVKQYESTVMPSLHFLLAAAKEGDRDALLGLQTGHQGIGQQSGILGQGGGLGGGGLNQHSREASYDEPSLSRSNSNNSNNSINCLSNLNNNGICNNNNSNNGHTGRQIIHGTKNSPTDWLLSGSSGGGGDTFRSSGAATAADADLYSYQIPMKTSTIRQNSQGSETYLDDGRQNRSDKGPSPLNGSSNINGSSGMALSLAPPSMVRETSLSRELSFAFGSSLNSLIPIEPTGGELDMPQLNRNHSLFGYLEVPSLPRSTALTRPYDDPFNSSPRANNAFGSSSRSSGQTSSTSAAPYMSLFSGSDDLYQYSAQSTVSKPNGGSVKNGEHLVHYILAKPLHTDVGSMGIPAFDQGKSLIGLYREGQGQDKSTILDYLPLSALLSVLTSADCLRAKDSLEEAISNKNRSVHVLGSNSSTWKNSLEMMKEDAMIFSLAGEAEEEEKLHNIRKFAQKTSTAGIFLGGTYDRIMDEKEKIGILSPTGYDGVQL